MYTTTIRSVVCGVLGCRKLPETSSSRLRLRDVLAKEQTTGGKKPRLCCYIPVITKVDIVADSASPVTIGAVAVLGFFIGLFIITIFARVIRRRRGSQRHPAMVADEEWHGQIGRGMFTIHTV